MRLANGSAATAGPRRIDNHRSGVQYDGRSEPTAVWSQSAHGTYSPTPLPKDKNTGRSAGVARLVAAFSLTGVFVIGSLRRLDAADQQFSYARRYWRPDGYHGRLP